MADTHGEHHDHRQMYYIVGGALGIATVISFASNLILGHSAPVASAVIIMCVSVIKACLVGWIFMHLKWDWTRVYFIIFPLMILGTMMIIVLLPDIVFAWKGMQPFEVPIEGQVQ